MTRTDARTDALAVASALSALLLVILCAIAIATGVSQQWFEWARPSELYAARLVHDARWLRAEIAIDDAFIAAYVSATVLLATALRREGSALPWLVVACGVTGGVLDLDENHHLLTLLALAREGIVPTLGEIVRRSELSQLKWMLGHLAFVLVALQLSPRAWLERAFRTSLLFVQLPLGALVWAVSDPWWDPVLLWARYAALLSGFALIAWMRPAAPAPAGADAAGSGARA